MSEEIGTRVREAMSQAGPGHTQGAVASRVGMTPDAFSRALRGQRGFASVELARLADYLGIDVYWLITGRRDPLQVRIAARHEFESSTGARSARSWEQDAATLEEIKVAYRQAYPGGDEQRSAVRNTAQDFRDLLGDGFIRPFADRLESRAGIDVVRIPRLATSYLMSIVGRYVIVMPTTGSWFWENWSLAHELGHLANGDLLQDMRPHRTPAPVSSQYEAAANAFAAELLLPETRMRSVDWSSAGTKELADFLWDTGVSASALGKRLIKLGLRPSPDVARALQGTTQRALRQHLPHDENGLDAITVRMENAAARRFPVSLQERHRQEIAGGRISKATLAWMLDVPTDLLEVDEPSEATSVQTDDLADFLGLAMP